MPRSRAESQEWIIPESRFWKLNHLRRRFDDSKMILRSHDSGGDFRSMNQSVNQTLNQTRITVESLSLTVPNYFSLKLWKRGPASEVSRRAVYNWERCLHKIKSKICDGSAPHAPNLVAISKKYKSISVIPEMPLLFVSLTCFLPSRIVNASPTFVRAPGMRSHEDFI